MSLFNDYVVRSERRTAKEMAGTLTLIEVSRRHEFLCYAAVIGLTLLFGLVSIVNYLVASYLSDPANLEGSFSYYREHWPENVSSNWRSFWVFQALLTVFYINAGGLTIRHFIRQAISERRRIREQKVAAKAKDDARKAAVVAETSRQETLAAAEIDKRQRALFEFRLKALRHMEEGILQVRNHYRKRAEFLPERVDEEHIYEMVRRGIRHSKSPEFGILRRSFDPEVTAVLGDQSYLPPEPSDELLMNRHLPPVSQLLGIKG